MAQGMFKFAIVDVNYFIKWMEAELLASITKSKITNFIWKSIVCRFDIPHIIVINNEKYFDNVKFREFCYNLGLIMHSHPQCILKPMDKGKLST